MYLSSVKSTFPRLFSVSSQLVLEHRHSIKLFSYAFHSDLAPCFIHLTSEAPTIDLFISRLTDITTFPGWARYNLSILNSFV